MAEFIFISPSVKFKEVDLTVTNSSLGITTAGLVGETTKGPAFEPVFITSKTEFRTRFGGQSTERLGSNLKYLLPFYANSYLAESNQLYVTRVLGLSGYDAGPAWGLKLSAGLDISTTAVTATNTGTTSFTGGTFSGDTVIAQTGVTFTIDPTYVKGGTTFTGTKVDYIVNNYVSTITGLSGNVTYTASTITGSSYSQYEGMVVAVIRSRGLYSSNTLNYNATALTLTNTAATTNVYADFTISTSGLTSESYNCSLDPTSSNFISKVIGSKPKDKTTSVFVESTYPDLIKKLEYDGIAYGLSVDIIEIDDCSNTVNFKTSYKTPETPWVVSQLRGGVVDRLFKFISISDGDSANKEIKISIQNINLDTLEFDVIIRDFNDTDDNVIVLETFQRCSMDKSATTFIAKRIGDNGINFDNRSNFVYLEFDDIDALQIDSFPAGFEGYTVRAFDSANVCVGDGLAPNMLYKKSYSATDKLNKTYLGVSERAFDTNSKGNSINQNLFNYQGELTETGSTKTKGFHLDSGATASYYDGTYFVGEFEVGTGKIQTNLDVIDTSNPYNNIRTRKFTLVPFGGFDGWDIYRDERTVKNIFKVGGSYYETNNDYDAYTQAYETFQNVEEVQINLFATPGLNWADHTSLVQDCIDLIEDVRQDSLYIIDAPDLTGEPSTYVNDITDLLNTTDIDSSYSTTYGPWIQVTDQDSGGNVYIPPTGEVLRAMAFTDNNKFPWFAPAGFSRGVLNAKKARTKLSEPQRDVLYANRINPIATFSGVGVDIFGQKTLQIKDSDLDRINVRRLLLYLRKAVANVSYSLLFEQNDDEVVRQFLNKVNPIFTNVKRERGLYDFKIEYQSVNTPESRDRNELYFVMYIKPTKALEFIGISFVLTPSGVSFENV